MKCVLAFATVEMCYTVQGSRVMGTLVTVVEELLLD